MFKSRLPVLVWFVVSALALYAWWFALKVVLRSVVVWKQVHPVLVPPEFSPAFDHQGVVSLLFYAMCAWGACLGCVMWVAHEKLRWIEKQMQVISILSFLVAAYLLGAGAFGALNVNRSQDEKLAVFEDALKRFALLESAQGRWDKFASEIEAFQRAKLVKARPVEQWSEKEVQAELFFLTGLLSDPSVETQRMVLATIALFRGHVANNPKLAYTLRGLPVVASRLGLGAFSDPASVLEAVTAKNNQKEWTPLPLARFEVRK